MRRRRITAVQLRDIGDAFGPCQLEKFLVEVVGRNSQRCAAYCKSVNLTAIEEIPGREKRYG